MASEPRSAAAQAGVCDEQMLIHEASRAFMVAATVAQLDDAWALYVAPVEASISGETLDILTRLRDLRRASIAYDAA
jgi:hypothetical protein